MKILKEGLRKFLDTRKGGSKKIRGGGLQKYVYFKTNRRGGGGLLKKIEPPARGVAKISSFEFQYLYPPFDE